MQLLLIRHGQSTNNKLHADTGEAVGRVSDPRLTDLGHVQARKLAEILGQRGIPRPTHLYSSLMIRTIETAAPLAEATGLPIVARTDSFECGGPYVGAWQDEQWSPGSSRRELQAVTPVVELPDVATD
ncbi:MAG: histidine phosphatase family protein, partial [Propionibacteriaceae bacterium]